MALRLELHRGICRLVVLVGPWAVKVPTTRPYGHRGGPTERLTALARGVLANQSEVAWASQEGLCPLVFTRLAPVLQVYRRCEPVSESDVAAHDDHGWWRAIAPSVPFGDRKAQNLGWLEGKLVWVDYDSSWNGCPHTPWNAMADDDE